MNWLLLFVRRPNLWAENIVFYDESLGLKRLFIPAEYLIHLRCDVYIAPFNGHFLVCSSI
jgi:hypothetical protein